MTGRKFKSRDTMKKVRRKPEERILKRIRESIQQVDPQAEVILFGSRARNEERSDSDWDLLILVPAPVSLKDEQKFRHKLFELELGQTMSILL